MEESKIQRKKLMVNTRSSFSSEKTFSLYFRRGLWLVGFFFPTRANIIEQNKNGAQLDQITGETMQVNVLLGLQFGKLQELK